VGLHLKLVITGAATTFVCIAMVTVIVAMRQSTVLNEEIEHSTQELRQSMIERGGLLAESIAASMENAIAGYNFLFVTETMKSVEERTDDLVYGYVANAAGTILVHTDDAMVGRTAPPTAATGKPVIREIGGAESYVEVAHPIRVGGEAWGSLILVLDLAPINRRAAAAMTRGREITVRSTTAATAIALLTALLGLSGSIILSRRLLRPVGQLAKEAVSIAEGDLDEEIREVESADEIGLLARQFERMRRSVKSNMAELVLAKQEAEAATREEQRLRSEIERHSRLLERKVRERTAELQATNERLTEYDRLKNEFLNNVSHELRSPLAAISSAAKIINRYSDKDPRNDSKFSSIIIEESRRLSRLINDLLDLAKIEAGGIDWELKPIEDPAILLTHVTETFKALATEHNLDIRVRTGARLPPILGDHDRLIQVITNICANAVKFTPRGGRITVEAEATTQENTPWVKFSVTDTGHGIPSNQLEAVFDRFHQVQPGQGEHKPTGTGLGLAICREVVSYHGGDIWAENTAEGGTRITFVVPATAEIDAPLAPGDRPSVH
jgi:signal transduction histidine kinase